MSAVVSWPRITLIDEAQRLLLRAATAPDALALPALRSWRRRVPWNDVTGEAHRAMPALVDLVVRNGLDEPDLRRLQGVHRHVWATNALKLKHLLVALDVLRDAGVEPMLLKGGALFARMPQLAARRPTGDYDVLVPDGAFAASVEALQRAGFTPLAMSWHSLVHERDTIDTSGTALQRADRDSLVDLHWRPLKYLHDPELTERLFAEADEAVLQGRPIVVPNPTHHLFLAIARCDPYDHGENFQRLLEGYMLLAGLGTDRVDWSELARLLRKYGLQAVAASYLAHIARECALGLSGAETEGLLRSDSAGSWAEAWLRTIPPRKREPLQDWFLARRERIYLRAPSQEYGPSLGEAVFRSMLQWLPLSINGVRRAMIKRIRPGLGGERAFVEGWFYAEPEGRWTNGQLAALTVPLSEAERNGKPVSFRGHLMPGRKGAARLVATGGSRIVRRRRAGPPSDLDFELIVRPEPRLGGGGLVVFWMPDAISPAERGESGDSRRLGLFLRTVKGT